METISCKLRFHQALKSLSLFQSLRLSCVSEPTSLRWRWAANKENTVLWKQAGIVRPLGSGRAKPEWAAEGIEAFGNMQGLCGGEGCGRCGTVELTMWTLYPPCSASAPHRVEAREEPRRIIYQGPEREMCAASPEKRHCGMPWRQWPSPKTNLTKVRDAEEKYWLPALVTLILSLISAISRYAVLGLLLYYFF